MSPQYLTYSLIWGIPLLAGLVMMLGALFLLYKGAIRLDRTPAHQIDETLVAELKQVFSIRAGNPVVAIFVIGLLCVLTPLFVLLYVPSYQSLRIDGRLVGITRPGEIHAKLRTEGWLVTGHPEGDRFSLETSLAIDRLQVEVAVPGAGLQAVVRNFTERDIQRGVLKMSDVDFSAKKDTPSLASVCGYVVEKDASGEKRSVPGLQVFLKCEDPAEKDYGPAFTDIIGQFAFSEIPASTKKWRLEIRSGKTVKFREPLAMLNTRVDFGQIVLE
jgi:hypothetical protein